VNIDTPLNTLFSHFNAADSYAVLTVDNQECCSGINLYDRDTAQAAFYGFVKSFATLKNMLTLLNFFLEQSI